MNTSRKSILITGAAGFIGSTLAKHLLKEYNLIMLDDLSYGSLDNLIDYSNGVKPIDLSRDLIQCDITEYEQLEYHLGKKEIDIVIHCAAIAPLADCQVDPNRAIDVNVNGWINVLEISRKLGVKSLYLASTNAVYENQLLPSETITNVPTLVYPLTKYFAEAVAQSYIDTYRMHITIMRFANVYGPNMDIKREFPPFIAYLVRELLIGNSPVIFNGGASKRNYIYSKDLCSLVSKMILDSTCRIVDICGFDNCTPLEIYKIVSEEMNIHIEHTLGDKNKHWDKYKSLYETPYPINEQLLIKEINKETIFIQNKDFDYLDWSPKYSIRDGLRETISAYRKLIHI
jgi:UDP-glucose 4-epimerase